MDGLSVPAPARSVAAYLDAMEGVVAAISREAVDRFVDRLFAGWQADATTFIIGNGGSASTASHMMNDLSKMTTVPGARRFRALALSDNVPLMTAVANDIDYREIFVEQLRSLYRPGDLLVAISGSGNSPNVVRAAEYVRAQGGAVLALCGLPGSSLCAQADVIVSIPSSSICQQEDGHLIVNHTTALALRDRIAATLVPS
jgi:D-sedoheptulose 7-phosphate isomerase